MQKDEERNKKELKPRGGNSSNDAVDGHVDLQGHMGKQNGHNFFLPNELVIEDLDRGILFCTRFRRGPSFTGESKYRDCYMDCLNSAYSPCF